MWLPLLLSGILQNLHLMQWAEEREYALKELRMSWGFKIYHRSLCDKMNEREPIKSGRTEIPFFLDSCTGTLSLHESAVGSAPVTVRFMLLTIYFWDFFFFFFLDHMLDFTSRQSHFLSPEPRISLNMSSKPVSWAANGGELCTIFFGCGL